jgi:hypothetical protein
VRVPLEVVLSGSVINDSRLYHTVWVESALRSCLGQRHGHQSTTLTSLFYKNLYWKVIYVYSYESNFQNKSIYMIFTFSNSKTTSNRNQREYLTIRNTAGTLPNKVSLKTTPMKI